MLVARPAGNADAKKHASQEEAAWCICSRACSSAVTKNYSFEALQTVSADSHFSRWMWLIEEIISWCTSTVQLQCQSGLYRDRCGA